MGLTPCPGQFSQQGPQSAQNGGMQDLQVWQEGDGKGLSYSASCSPSQQSSPSLQRTWHRSP